MLTTMFNRVEKHQRKTKKSIHPKTIKNNVFLSSVFTNTIIMPVYLNYIAKKEFSYQISLKDSKRYSEYIRFYRNNYNVVKITFIQIKKITAQHSKLKSEVKETITKLFRL